LGKNYLKNIRESIWIDLESNGECLRGDELKRGIKRILLAIT